MNVRDLRFDEEPEEEYRFMDERTTRCPKCGDAAYKSEEGFICFGCGWRGEK